MMRKAVVAGEFYPLDSNSLKEEIKSCFLSKLGPGSLPERKGKKEAVAGLVPHAGYAFSGACAAHFYRWLSENWKPTTIAIAGPSHTAYGYGISLMKKGSWETPLGSVEIDEEIAEKIEEAGVVSDPTPFIYEHSIEVQLPFLKFLFEDIKFVPICIAEYEVEEIERLASKLAELKVALIATSDLTHYGPSYGFVPFTKKVKEQMYELDKRIINAVLNLDLDLFLSLAEQTTVCGVGAIALLICYAKELGLKGKLLRYYTSGDVIGDYINAVGYASIAYE